MVSALRALLRIKSALALFILYISPVVYSAANCTAAAKQSQCSKFYPASYIANFEKVDPSKPYFQDYTLRALELKQICTTYESYAKCAAEATVSGGCQVDAEQRLIFAFVCELLNPLVAEDKTNACWNATSILCKFSEESENAPKDANRAGMCNFLESVELQINCALSDEMHCSDVSQNILRRARSETSSQLADYRCLGDLDENLALNKEAEITIKPQDVTITTKPEENANYCTSAQNRAASECLVNLWGIEQYLKQMENITLAQAVLKNETALVAACTELAAYKLCMSKLDEAKNCQYKSAYHSLASLLTAVCDMYALSPCLKQNDEKCGETVKSINTNLEKVSKDNDRNALCQIISEVSFSLRCLSKSVTSECKSELVYNVELQSESMDKKVEQLHCEKMHADNESTVESITAESAFASATTESSGETASNSSEITEAVSVDEIGKVSEHMETESESNITVLAQTVNCTTEETMVVEECVKPFRSVTDKIELLTSGGMSALVRGLNNMTQLFHEGCALRKPFESCISNGIKKDSQCKIVSCLLKIGETECKESAESRSIETKIRCMFSLVAEPIFRECIKKVPSSSFSNFNQLKKYLPELVQCLKEPILSKCGPESWRLVTALSSSVNSENIDLTCVVNFEGESSNLETKVIEPEKNLTLQVKLGKSESIESNETGLDMEKNGDMLITSLLPDAIFQQTNFSGEQKEICTEEYLKTKQDCVELLSTYKPLPISFYDQTGKIDKACPLYNKFKMCLDQYNCRYPLGEAYKTLIEQLCTTHYEIYKEEEICLRRITMFNNKVATCIAKFNAVELKHGNDLPAKACDAVTTLLTCSGDLIDDQCDKKSTDFLFSIYNAFVKVFNPNCTPSRQEIGAAKEQCTFEQRASYFECRGNFTLNPISIVDKAAEFGTFCSNYSTVFQNCVNQLPCVPEPAHQAFNDTVAYICNKTSEFATHGECLAKVSSSKNAEDCLKAYKDIVIDDPSKIVCRKLNSAMECAAPLIIDKCQTAAIGYISDVMSHYAVRYRAGCTLNIQQIFLPNDQKEQRENDTMHDLTNDTTTMSPKLVTKPSSSTSLRFSLLTFVFYLFCWILFC